MKRPLFEYGMVSREVDRNAFHLSPPIILEYVQTDPLGSKLSGMIREAECV